MYQLQLSDFTKKEFLRHYWQQKPVVIRRGFSDFQDPLSADELAGLATMEQVESRLVSLVDGQWQAAFGPFDTFEHLGENNWSLVVQAVDHFCEEAAQLIEPFRFIPNWRLDDLMVSFATPGGGVGPHIDLYDVFICQGSGKRHWRVGDKGEHREFAAHEALLHVDPFEAKIDVELNPGDILYIPPGFPHEGITLETSLSFSVGFRTQSRVSLFSALADHLIDQDSANELIEDASRAFCNAPGEINDSDLHLIQEQFTHVLADKALMRTFIGSHLSQAKHELDRNEEALGGYSQGDVAQILAEAAEQGAAQQGRLRLQRLGGLRAFYFSDILKSGVCYINGESYAFDVSIAPAIKLLCDQVSLSPQQLTSWCENSAFIAFVTEQVNAGYWYFAQD